MQENNYYAEQLNAQKLFRVYDTAIPRVQQYLDAEIDFVRRQLQGHERVLELGAGYGRIMRELAPHCQHITGIDIAAGNINVGKEYLIDYPNTELLVMDVHKLTFQEPFDVCLCLQNGLSSMKLQDQNILDILRYTKVGGKAFFSTYAAAFWDERLQWFREQADKGLLGEIDEETTKDGVIRCKDGFVATTPDPADLERLGSLSGYPFDIVEVDQSSLFLILEKTH